MKTSQAIRLAAAADADAIAAMSRDLVERGLVWRYTPARMLALIRHAETNVAVAANGAGMAGFGVMEYGDERAHLVLLAVRPARRRQGLGAALVGWLEAVAVTAGMETVTVEARAGNDAALALYDSLGYTQTARLRGYYDGREDAVRLVKTLRQPA